MTGNNFYLTKEGLKEIKKEYESLKAVRASKLRGDVPNILESGDPNPDYAVFQEDLNLIESRLAELEKVLENASIIKKTTKKDYIDLGATVTVDVNGKNDKFIIVGSVEADPLKGKISNESPVGEALIGHRKGEEVPISSPIKAIYKIKKINYS